MTFAMLVLCLVFLYAGVMIGRNWDVPIRRQIRVSRSFTPPPVFTSSKITIDLNLDKITKDTEELQKEADRIMEWFGKIFPDANKEASKK